MNLDDSGEFGRRLVTLAEVFDKKLSPQSQALYFQALRDLSFTDVAGALSAAVKVCTFMPKPAELRKLATGDHEDLAEAAWMAFRRAMNQQGAYRSLLTHDPALGETILAMFQGWPEACTAELSPEMWASKRKEFGRIYRVLKDRGLRGARYLQGITEQQNMGRLDWAKYTEVALIDGDNRDVKRLSAPEAEVAKALIAATPHGFSSVRELSAAIDIMPSDRTESA